ncbi:MAG: HAD-IA family hydrolase [Gemmatimonadetes bacterium]|nr:HAD-IA family hydrolase [Gemmatimonadota bacterium]
MPVRAVFFDLYNTIARFDPSREELQARAATEFGISLTAEGVSRGYHTADAFFAATTSSRPIREMSGEEQERFFSRYQQLILEGAGHDVDLDTAGRMWHRVRSQRYGMKLFEDVIPTFDRLRADGRVVGVISNYARRGAAIAEDLGFAGHADFTVTSLEAGAQKPDPAIFRMALARAGVEASGAVHVGDQIESDVQGALAAGIRPVLIDRYGGHAGYRDHPRIERLDELPGVLAAMEA